LLAIIFKIFAGVLPKTFQYWGIWGLLSFILQGGISACILKKLTHNKIIASAGTLFFCVSPIILTRLFSQSSMGGHFVILLAILIWIDREKTSPYELYQYLLNKLDKHIRIHH